VAGDADVQIVRGVLTSADDGAIVSPWERAAALGPDVILWAPASPGDVRPALDHGADEGGPGTFGDAGAGLPALVIVADVTTADVVEAVRAGARAVLPTATGAAAVTRPSRPPRPASSPCAFRTPTPRSPASPATPGRSRAPTPPPPRAPVPGVLSAREREVLALMAEGLATSRSRRGSASASTRSRRTSRPCSPSSARARARGRRDGRAARAAHALADARRRARPRHGRVTWRTLRRTGGGGALTPVPRPG
jgi:DNA-binding NarL/FixJ family response regulator